MKQDRFGELDALRGFAALAVVLFHYTMRAAREGAPLFDFEIGVNGVELFFCISGFVIYWTLERSKRLADFAVSRFSRLYPAYWAALAVLFVVDCVIDGDPFWVTGYAINATMAQSFVGVKDLDLVYWTLGVELVFYVWMAVIYKLGQLERIVPICVGWLALVTALGVAGHQWQLPHWVSVFFIFRFAPFFIAGMMFYRLRTQGLRAAPIVVLALAAVAVMIIDRPTRGLLALTLFAIFALAISGRLRWIVNPATAWLGTISYSLYLTHRAFGEHTMVGLIHSGVNKYVAMGVAIAAVIVLASAITMAVERPALKLIRAGYKKLVLGRKITSPSGPALT